MWVVRGDDHLLTPPRLLLCLLSVIAAGCHTVTPGVAKLQPAADVVSSQEDQTEASAPEPVPDADDSNPEKESNPSRNLFRRESVSERTPARKSTGGIQLMPAEAVFSEASIDPPPSGPLSIDPESAFASDDDGFASIGPSFRPLPLFPDEEKVTPEPADEIVAEGEDLRPISFRDDVRGLFPMLKADSLSVLTWQNAIVLGAGAGGALAIRASHTDGRVRDDTLEHPLRWGTGSHVLRNFGEPEVQAPVIFALYGLSLWKQDPELHNFMKATISAYSVTSLTTVAIKGIADTSRPSDGFQGGHYGFPSFHTASAFAISATIEEYYGWKFGVPAYVLSGLVGWSRIDQREHDLSDVVFGAVLGYVIGKSIAATHVDRDASFKIAPYYDSANQTSGVTLEAPF